MGTASSAVRTRLGSCAAAANASIPVTTENYFQQSERYNEYRCGRPNANGEIGNGCGVAYHSSSMGRGSRNATAWNSCHCTTPTINVYYISRGYFIA